MDLETIRQLSRTFSVQDIMTEATSLKRARTVEDARTLFHEFDVIPFPRKGKIEGYFQRGYEDCQKIETTLLVSEATPLLDLPQLFCENLFYFVISANRIIGYVHYSDLNKPLVKIPFFALFQAVERKLWDKFHSKLSENDIEHLFPNESNKFLTAKKKVERNNVNLGWVGIFSFPYILKLARHYGLIDLSDEEIKQLKELRNQVAHSDHNLINDKSDVKTLAESQNIFIELLN